jgi:hypothetical protein
MRSVAGLLARDNVYRPILRTVHINNILQNILTGNLKMKKTIIALAVVGAFSTSVQAGVSGFAGFGYWSNPDATDADNANAKTRINGLFGLNMSSSVETDGGSTVYGNVSLTKSGGRAPMAQSTQLWITGAHVGIKGAFGDVFLGNGGSGASHGQFAGDRHDVTINGRRNESVGYRNTVGPASFTVTMDPAKDGVSSMGVSGTFSGVTVGFGKEDKDTVVGAKMAFGAIGVALHKTTWDNGDDSGPAIKVSYSAGAISASYQTESRTTGGVDNVRSQIDAAYSLGGGAAVKLRNRANDANTSQYTRILLTTSF